MSRIVASCLSAVLLGAALVAVPSIATAAALTVTTTADVVDGGDGQTSLREAFATAGSNGVDDVITLASAQTYQLTECGSGPLTHAEAKELVVQGAGSVIEQTCDATGIIDSTSHDGRLELNDLIVDGGPNTTATAIEGAAVRSDSELLLVAVEIREVLSPGGSVVWSSFGHGTTPYRLTILDSNLHGNTGTVVSCDNCSAEVRNTTVAGNTGSGFSFVDGYPIVMDTVGITGNTRTGISNTGQGFAVNKTQVDYSDISGNGRAGILCSNCGRVQLYSTTVSNNGLTAADARGGIWMSASKRANGSTGITTVHGIIEGNKSVLPGGGVSMTPALIEDDGIAPEVTLDRTQVQGNQSVGGGGGVWVGFGSAGMYKGSLIGNSTTGGNGGGLATVDATGPYDLAFDETEITGNTATGDGGGVYALAITAFFASRSKLSDNVAGGNGGGARLVNSLSVDLTDHEVSGNTAANGAGLDVATESLTADRVGFVDNQATGTGGAARIAAVGASFVNSTFSGNGAATGGGFATIDAAVATLDHVTMADNEASTGAHVAGVPGAELKVGKSALVLPETGASCAGIAGTSLGYSVLADASCGSAGTDLVTAADPQLGPVTGKVRVPTATSPLGGRVPVAQCTVGVDQRQVLRPVGDACEAGSVEIEEAASPDEALVALIAEVKALDLPKGIESSLVLKLELARKKQPPVAKALLSSFIAEVKAWSGKFIPPAVAAQLVTKATAIRDSL